MLRRRLHRMVGTILIAMLILLVLPSWAWAIPSQRCFAATGFCIAGRLLEYWDQNGGLPVFGMPITPQQIEIVAGQRLQVQWFERNRLELHPENPPPYDVLLGRLGAERMQGSGASASPQPASPLPGSCELFATTGYTVCGAFLDSWHANGVDIDGQPGSEGDSMALFGLPLSNPESEQLSDGHRYLVQWFERARFEYHPENPASSQVLFGLLGSESHPAIGTAVVVQPVRVVPVHVAIPSIGLDDAITPSGLDSNNIPIVPDHTVGWFTNSALPGHGNNIVFWGHVLRFRNAPTIPAPFANLKTAAIGDHVIVSDSDGSTYTYVITQKIWATPDQVQYIEGMNHEQLTMVSCIGQAVIAGDEVVDMSNRLITIARPL